MLAMTRDIYARDTAHGRETYRAGIQIEASQDELDVESRRRFPRLVPFAEESADEVLDREMDNLASCDATADAMLAALDSQRFREGFERPLAGVRVAARGIFGRGDVSVDDALDRLTGGGSYAQA